MSWFRLLLLLPVGGAVWALTLLPGLRSFATSQAAPTTSADATVQNDQVYRLLQRAHSQLKNSANQWLEARVWQRASLEDLCYVAVGRHLLGPLGRCRLELQTQCGSAAGRMLIVSDGARTLRASAVNNEPWTDACFVDAAQIVNRSKNRVTADLVRCVFLQGNLAEGPLDLLDHLEKQLIWVKVEKVKRGSHLCWKLHGTCVPQAGATASPDGTTADDLMRQCHLYLDVDTLWPHRVEWWGREHSDTTLKLLFQLEYRDPVACKTFSPARIQEEFGVDPAAFHAVDQTDQIADQLQVPHLR